MKDTGVKYLNNAQVEDLISGAIKGEKDAVEELIKEIYPQIRSIVLRNAADQGYAEDLVHDILLEILKSLRSFKGTSSFSTYYYRISMNVINAHFRKEYRRKRLGSQYMIDEIQNVDTNSKHNSLDKIILTGETAVIHQIISGLKEKRRVVFMLYEIEGKKGEEIAEILGIKLNTVWSRLLQARKDFYSEAAKAFNIVKSSNEN